MKKVNRRKLILPRNKSLQEFDGTMFKHNGDKKKKKKTRPLIIGGLFDLIIPNTIDTGDDSLVKA